MPQDGFVGRIDRVGKGDKPRPLSVSQEQFADNGARVFGEDWALPLSLRRKRAQQLEMFPKDEQ